MLTFTVHPETPPAVQASLKAVFDQPHLMSPPLMDFLGFVQQHPSYHLVVEVRADGADPHGVTAVSVSRLGASEEILVEEAFLAEPDLILGPHEGFIELTVWAGPGSRPIEAAVTLLHELELHAVPAGLLFQRLAPTKPAQDARLGFVLDYMNLADDHLDLDRQEAYVRTAARIHRAASARWAQWGADLAQAVRRDALEQFGVAAHQVRDEASLKRGEWLVAASEAVLEGGPDVAVPASRPPARRLPAPVAAGRDVTGHMAQRVSERVGMLRVVDETRTLFHVPVGAARSLYRDQIVPALHAQAPSGLTDPGRRVAFLRYHGVPSPVAQEAAYRPEPAPPGLKIVAAWPPLLPVRWLTDAERLTWTPFTGLPESVKNARDIKDGDRFHLDDALYQAMVRAEQPMAERESAAFFRHELTGTYIALLRR